jgi:hypothetical protein
MTTSATSDGLIAHGGVAGPSSVVVEELVLLPPALCAPLRVVQCGAMRDVAVVGEGSDLTGLFVWPGARFFCEFLAALRLECTSADALSRWGCSGLVELGGGVGLGAFSASILWSGLKCWVTDILEAALLLAVTQRAHNAEELRRQGSAITLGILDWQWAAAATRGGSPSNVPANASCEEITILTATKFAHVVNGLAADGSDPNPHPELQRGVPWLVGLDIVYPDHSDENMHNLCGCIAAALRTRSDAATEASAMRHLLTQQCTLLFIDRDVGVTLRRLLVCASLYGLTVSPLLSPFHNGSGAFSKKDMLGWAAKHIAAPDATTMSVASIGWAALHHGVIESAARSTLGLKVCGGGEWLMCLSLLSGSSATGATTRDSSADLLTAVARSPHGTRIVTKSPNRPWVTSMPWLWAPEDPDHCTLWQAASSVAAVAKAVSISRETSSYSVDWGAAMEMRDTSNGQRDVDAMMDCCVDMDDDE